ncbi:MULTISPECIES: ATP-binding cassette domain-containing protein [Petrotoga]|uniref:Putative ABC transport system ATP-binding protein n=1 Tax=Petrotoga sibirica TaxID=156202 RepID=A0A4R8ESY3_9BACT|nr:MULTISPECIES: ATP-binding cassette domain-containing protein [Petrotoga]TDX15419.1 putative ABC transport system ATP-binding protein [Petrotoga sibirica]
MIEFQNVSKKFQGKYVLRNFNLKVQEGSKTLIFGKSGIGKTTIFRLLLGFMKPDEGQLLYKNERLNGKNIWVLRKETVYIGQELDVVDGTVREIIRNILSYKINLKAPFEESKLIELFDFFELEANILDKDFQALSGGEKQRVLISIFTLLNKKIYLLDESTSSLDREMKNKVIKYLLSKKEWTLIAISHDQEWLNNEGLNIIEMGGN